MYRREIRLKIKRKLDEKYGNKIENIKQNIIDENGREPTLTYYYYSLNPIKYAGEEWVRQSLESICDQGEVVIGDYNSNDGIKELAKEYGIKVLDVEPSDCMFPESKIANKIMFESKSNFMVYLNFNIIYPENFGRYCENWAKKANIKRKILRAEGGIYREDGSFKEKYAGCVTSIIYRPYLLYARGYDERLCYRTGTTEYAIFLLDSFFNLRWDRKFIDMKHRYYGEKDIYLKDNYGFKGKQPSEVYSTVEEIFDELDLECKNVVNSYW